MLSIERLSKRYGPHLLWKDLTRAVPSAAMTALTGPSGSGKSTLLNCIGLLDRPDSGTIIALARLIVRKPALILADEPTGALDEDNAMMVIGTLRQLADAGATVLIATHTATVRDACGEQIDLTRADHPDDPPRAPVPPAVSREGRGRSRRPADDPEG